MKHSHIHTLDISEDSAAKRQAKLTKNNYISFFTRHAVLKCIILESKNPCRASNRKFLEHTINEQIINFLLFMVSNVARAASVITIFFACEQI